MIVDKGVLKVAQVVEGVCFHMQSQRVPGQKFIIFKRSTIDMFLIHPSIFFWLPSIFPTEDCHSEPGQRFQAPPETGIDEPLELWPFKMEADINLDEIDHLGTTKSILHHFVLETIFLFAFFSAV